MKQVCFGLVATLIFAAAPVVLTQDSQEVVSQRIGGQEPLPLFFLVEEFFVDTVTLQKMGDDWLEFNLLRQLGVEPGSATATILVDGAKRGRDAALGFLPVDASEEPEASEARQRAFLRQKIQRTAVAYETLLVELAETGFDPRILEQHILAEFGPSVSAFSSRGDSPETRAYLAMVTDEFARHRAIVRQSQGGSR